MTNLTVFAALLKIVPMGCKDAVLFELPLKNHTINCFKFEENTRQANNDNLCLLRALSLSLSLSLFICTEIKHWKQKHQRFLICSSIEWIPMTHPPSVGKGPYERSSSCLGPSAPESFPSCNRHYGWQN